MKLKSISARIKDETAQKIDFLQKDLNLTQTDVIVKAVEVLYVDVQKQKEKPSPFDVFEDLGLIGCFEGDSDLSENYKSEIQGYLDKKHS